MNTRNISRIFPLLALAMLLPLCASVANAAATEFVVPDGRQLDFTVLREGKQVGRHLMTFSNNGDGLGVHIKTDVAVKFAFIPVYHFNHESRELWRDGRLAKLDSHTDDDGAAHTLTVGVGPAGLDVVGDGENSAVDPGIIPASLWNPGIARVGDAKLLNTLDGHLMAVTVRFEGEEDVTAGNTPVKARHFTVTGELERELWYDLDWMLVKARFKGSDGSDIQYVLR